ncbi:unnamed protein product [Chrysodeixis includens]|uniref:Nucleoporin NUP42 n=1 Tax=Chrysodeixis includens TaxID=689277 RepID=A0A9P0FVJ2_CHRIL|nr:unnamed protein product [Chrysodeixis includens]
MVVCKFFQQGYCRFGKNCRYEHIYGSKYSYHANAPAAAPAPAPVAQQPGGVTDEQLVNQVQSDIQAVLRGGQWIHSCYSPFKDKPYSFPGLTDLSPEEARLFMYEAKKNNTLGDALNFMNELDKTTKQKYAQMLQPNVAIIKVLRSLYKGEYASSPFGITQESNAGQNVFASNNTASSIFRSAVQAAPMNPQSPNNAQSIFSQAQKSIFNTPPSQPMDAAKDLFASANNTNVFGPSAPPTNIFQTQPNQDMAAKSIFASAVQNNFNTINQSNAASIFAAANQNTSPFSQSNVFQPSPTPGPVFGQQSKAPLQSDPGVYSMVDDLAEEDLQAYKGDSFQLGFIPDRPPPYELCMAPTNNTFFR